MNTFFKLKLLLEGSSRPTNSKKHTLSIKPIAQDQLLPINDEVQISYDNTNVALNWTEQINELETYFTTTSLPENPIVLNNCSTINNAPHFVTAHLTFIKANNGNPTFLPYMNRLQQVKQKLMQNTNGTR